MSKLRILLSVVVTLLLATQTYASKCENTTFSSYEADEAIQLINAARTKAYLGEQKNGVSNTMLPAARVVTRLSWSCFWEKKAFEYLSTECKQKVTPLKNGTYFRGSNDPTPVPLPRKIEYWLSEIAHNTLKVTADLQVLFESKKKLATLGYATLIRLSSTQVGCARQSCNPKARVPAYKTLCITDEKPLNNNEHIYRGNNDPNACPAKPFMSDKIRSAFLNKHNNLRSQLALGTVENGKSGKLCRPAKNMPKLVYDCELEKTAYDRARQCEKFKREETNTLQENSYNFTTRLNRNYEEAAKSITQLWWSELKASQGLSQTQNIFYTHLGINRFAKIASDLTTKIGCGMYDCGNKVNVVCRYKTTLEHAKRLYERGPSCKACSSKCTTGLCPAAEKGVDV